MQITYTLNQQDFVEAFQAHRNSRPWLKWGMRFVLMLACVALATATLAAVIMKSSLPMANFLPLSIWGFLCFGVYWGSARWAAYKQFKHQPSAQGPRTLILDDSGMHWKWDGGTADIHWKNYLRWVEGKDQFLLYVSPVVFNVLPKRSLSAGQTTEFRETLQRHIVAQK
jgi:hypothetical protein